MDLAELTAPVRVALARAITARVSADAELLARLDAELAESGFEDRTNGELIEMARAFDVDAARVDEILATQSADMSPNPRTFLCGKCRDEKVIETEPGSDLFVPCDNCNLRPPDVEFDPEDL